MNNRFVINFTPGETTMHKLNGATKVMLFVVITALIIATFDIRVHIPIFIACTAAIVSMKPNWKPLMFMYGFLLLVVGIWGSIMLFFVAPEAGLRYVGQETIIIRFNNYLYLSEEFLWYAFAMFFKRSVSFVSVMMFVLSVTPSELAAGLNFMKLPYKVCIIVSLGFRTIPNVLRDYNDISNSMQMRGVEMNSKKTPLAKRLKQVAILVVPLMITSFGKVESIANAMDLRGFGKHKSRSWYSEREPSRADYVFRIITVLLLAFTVFYIVYFRNLHPWPARYWYFNYHGL